MRNTPTKNLALLGALTAGLLSACFPDAPTFADSPAAGSAGKAGQVGKGGSAGQATAGTGGTASRGGAAGEGGTAGKGGSELAGAGGDDGEAGAAGTEGDAGEAGAGGTEGDAGTAGVSGASGQGGAAGAAGAAGAGGKSGGASGSSGAGGAGGVAGSGAAGAGAGGAPTGSGGLGGAAGTGAATGTGVALSCLGLPRTCGGVSGTDDCCASDLITGGSFKLGRSTDLGGTDAFPAGDANETPEVSSTISSYRLDRYEVTVGRYRKFVAAVVDGWRPPGGSGKHTHLSGGQLAGETGWDATWNESLPSAKATWDDEAHLSCDSTYQTWTPNPAAGESRPINCADWYQSQAFCIWDGGFLPTEAEWEYAAAGGEENRLYPWGQDGPDKTFAVLFCLFSGSDTCEAADLPAVGSAPKGKALRGTNDLAGSLQEWNLDWLIPDYPKPCNDCANMTPGTHRVIRGGDFRQDHTYQRAARRHSAPPTSRLYRVGFRCARTP